MNEELEFLNFKLREKKSKLDSINVNQFIFNPEAAQLASEIADLEEKIATIEEELANDENGNENETEE
jgi:hypothetical protein